MIVDRRMLKTYGAHALYIEGLSIRTETVAASRGKRPWTPDRAMIEIARPTMAEQPKDQLLDRDPEN